MSLSLRECTLLLSSDHERGKKHIDENLPVTALDQLEKLLQPPSADDVRYVPLPFSKEIKMIRAPYERAWPILGSLVQHRGQYRSLVYAAPPFWQHEIPVYRACRAHNIPFAAGHSHNMPVTVEMARQLSPSIVVLGARQIRQFEHACAANTLFQSDTPVIVVHQIGEEISVEALSRLRVMHVLELFSGYPITYTCAIHPRLGRWHLGGEYAWYAKPNAGPVIVPLSPEIPWFGALELPFIVKEKSDCACGRPSFALAPEKTSVDLRT